MAVVFIVAGILTVNQFVIPLYHLVGGHQASGLWADGFRNPCAGDARTHCGTITDFLKPLTAAALTFVWVYLFTYRGRKWYLRMAMSRPQELVQTANDTVDKVVGRDELCEVLVERIRDPAVRRPMVLVGGVGAGKTATLVSLTRELARRKIVPVPIRLRALDKDTLNFQQMARDRFLELVHTKLFNDAHGHLLWRQLLLGNQVAVLADGLEEAVTGDDGRARDSVLRTAIGQAIDDNLPLIIASRPYDPLRGMNAIIVGLEPLGEGAALEFGLAKEGSSVPSSWARVADLVDAADVTESPFFLKIIRDLNRHGRLPRGLGERGEPGTAARPMDRSAVRWKLLHAWEEALLDGHISEDFAHTRDERLATLDVLSAFACVGFDRNSAQIRFADLNRNGDGNWKQKASRYFPIYDLLRQRLDQKLDPTNAEDLALATVRGSELSIVDAGPNGVRFQHGVIQAYLGARFLADPRLGKRLHKTYYSKPKPSQELLIALTLLSRQLEHEPERTDRVDGRRAALRAFLATAKTDPAAELVTLLRKQANQRSNLCWTLEMYAAALEIDTSARSPAHPEIVGEIESQWHHFQEKEAAPDRPLDEAKLHLVRRMGDAARLITVRQRSPEPGRPAPSLPPPYASFFRLARREGSYRIRLAAAREIGLGGTDAARSLEEVGGLAPRQMDLGIGAEADELRRNEQQLRGWIAPLLYLSVHRDEGREESERHPRRTKTDLQKWLDALAAYDPGRPERRFEITSEFALAQGFRLAANMRRLPVGRQDRERSFLIEKAERALAHARIWYSQLVLVQALTLLSLPDDPAQAPPGHGHGADPYGMVQQWVRLAGSAVPGRNRRDAHPFLLEVSRLCVSALHSRRPERYCWIDEGETASRVGSSSASVDVRREQRQWIPDSMGWSVLTPRAQRLLADIMLLFNLADRGDLLVEREERLARTDRCDLPPCLTNDRRALEVTRSLHTAERCEPGATCLDDCPFRLCPLPAKGERLPHQMDQNFCARQADLAALRYALRAPWQSVPRHAMKLFWRQMSERQLPGWRK